MVPFFEEKSFKGIAKFDQVLTQNLSLKTNNVSSRLP